MKCSQEGFLPHRVVYTERTRGPRRNGGWRLENLGPRGECRLTMERKENKMLGS